MRRCLAIGVVLLAWSSASSGELSVGLEFENLNVLQFEPVMVVVKVRNNSATPFLIDGAEENPDARLRFEIQAVGGATRRRIDDRPLIRKLRLLPDGTQELMLDISLWYDVKEMGSYFVTAVVDRGEQTFRSTRRVLDVVSGIELAKVTRALPGVSSIQLTYTVRYWSRGRREHAFLRIDDEKRGVNYGVFPLGTVVRVFRPVVEVDRSGKVTVFHQSGGDRYTRSFFQTSRRGTRFVNQEYHRGDGQPYSDLRPRLVPKLPEDAEE